MDKGLISTGSKQATEAANEILKIGGNAFDAAITAVMVSMTSEVNLTSMAGGGALMAYQKGKKPILFDFFVDAPSMKKKKSFEFYKTEINFGETVQEFYIGKGSIAIPGNIKGLLHVHKRLGKLPLNIVTEPAVEIAKNGVELSKSQAYITNLLESIIKTSKNSRKLFYNNDKLISKGDLFKNTDLADFIQWITEEGDRPFYEGEIGQKMIQYLGDDGLISQEDLKEYKVVERIPVNQIINDKIIYTNPLPSVGGTLIIFLLRMLYNINKNYLVNNELLIKLMAATTKARFRYFKDADNQFQLEPLLSDEVINKYSALINDNILDSILDFNDNGLGSTTHVSIVDRYGNAASVTTTNGESCGHVLPGTGIILNNMLGEEDLNPLGFHNWKNRKRLPTLISPTILLNKNGDIDLVLGSAGSNRIRSAIVQVVINYIIKGMNLKDSIYHPRIHLEGNNIYIEPNIKIDCNLIKKSKIEINSFPERNLFFGGVNAVSQSEAVSDPRRGGYGLVC